MTTPLAPFSGLSRDSFAAAVQNLMPRGMAWPRAADSIQTAVAQALAQGLVRFNTAISNFCGTELDPNETVVYLPNWFSLMGLPVIPWATIAQQQALLNWRLQDKGGFAPSRYIAMMAALGITIEVTKTAAWTLSIQAPAALSAAQRATLGALVTPRMRAGTVFSFDYDL
jgi:uncharacterized protein YmfQ (DUF2313 family)